MSKKEFFIASDCFGIQKDKSKEIDTQIRVAIAIQQEQPPRLSLVADKLGLYGAGEVAYKAFALGRLAERNESSNKFDGVLGSLLKGLDFK